MADIIFSVCTPTFNRAHTLDRVFDSLQSQTMTSFEWIVIDDGSSDSTKEQVKGYVGKAKFPIIYEHQSNKGKHVAVNAGAQLAAGELFLIADSDDSFPEDALQVFYETWQGISKKIRNNFTGVTGLCMDEKCQIVGDYYPADIFDSTPAEMTYRYGIKGEKWGFHRTDVIRAFPFPELAGFKFFAESIIWNSIGRKFKTRYINKPVRIYNQDAGDQITHRSPIKNSQTRIFYVMGLNDDQDYLFVAPIKFIKMAVQGVRFSLHQADTISVQFNRLNGTKVRLLWALALTPGLVLYLKDLATDTE